MSKIQKALGRLQKEAPDVSRSAKSGATMPVRKGGRINPRGSQDLRTEVLEGESIHHVDPNKLEQAGVLMPLDVGSGLDEFRRIKRPILDYVSHKLSAEVANRNTVIITSAMPRAGKSFCSLSLAASISREKDSNVVLVDGDVAKSHITKQLGLGDRPGLMGLLSDGSIDLANALVRTDFNDIVVLPSGQTHERSTEHLASERMSDILDDLSEFFSDRIIIVDSPPMLITSEAQALSDKVAQIVVVVESGVTTHHALEETLRLLDSEKAISVILNKSRHAVRNTADAGGYGYYGY